MNNKRELRYEAEDRFHWLTPLLDAYETADEAYKRTLEHFAEEKGINAACKIECCNCCIDQTIFVMPPELSGITWYLSEQVPADKKEIIARKMMELSPESPCPFLIEKKCAIYPVRPLTCRTFYVASKACESGENVFKTRPGDIIRCTPEETYSFVEKILEAAGIPEEQRKEKIRSGYVSENSTHLNFTLMNLGQYLKIRLSMPGGG